MLVLRTRAFAPIALLSVLFLSFGFYTYAQQGSTTQDPISVSVQPQVPSPGVETTISLESTSVDLNSAQMSWSVDGVVMKEGSSLKAFTFTMGKAGQQTTIRLTVRPAAGSSFTRTFTFKPGSVTLLWEANTYVPPFYKGKSLYSPGASIRFLAIPQITDQSGNLIDASQLVYKWEINSEVYADKSGKGKSTLDLSGNQLNSGEQVAVEIARADKSIAARGSVTVPTVDPIISFYKRDPLRGVIYNESLIGEKKLTEAETTIVAEPYYVSGTKRAQSGFTYEWNLNGKVVQSDGGDPLMITLRQAGQQSGEATLTFSLQNMDPKRILQNATGALKLILGGGQSTNTFGI